MLDSMRKGASSIFAKALMLLLVLSFGLWGIGDMIRNSGSQQMARVGDARISPQEFNDRFQRITSQMPNLPQEMLASEGLRAQVLQGMVQQLLLLQEAADVGLLVNNEVVARVIHDNPQFQNDDGSFSDVKFLSFLQNNRIGEGQFVETLRRDVESTTVLKTLDVPENLGFGALSSALDTAKKQTRVAELYIIPPVAINTAEPPREKLEAFYKSIEKDYMLPETRDLEVISIGAEALKAHAGKAISDDEIAERYEAEKASLGTPETRDVKQFLFNSQAEANAAFDALKKADAVKGGKPQVLKAIVQSKLPKEAAAAVFAARKGDVIQPVETAFGWHVFKIEGITEGKHPPLDAVKAQIAAALVEEKLEDTLFTLTGTLEDALAAGDTLQEAAVKLGVSAQARTLKADAAQVVAEKPTSTDAFAIAKGFSLGEDEFSSFEAFNDQYIAVHAKQITPAVAKPLKGMIHEVTKRYQDAEQKNASAQRAAAIATQLLASDNPQAIADKEKLQRRSFGPISLGQALSIAKPLQGVPVELQRRVFDVPLGGMTPPVKADNGSWMMAKVVKVTQAETSVDADDAAPADTLLTSAVNNTVYANFLKHLTQRYPVSVNDEMLRQKAAQP